MDHSGIAIAGFQKILLNAFLKFHHCKKERDMKGTSIFAALGLAVALLALGSNSASADHCGSGYYGHGSYHGGYHGTAYYGSSHYGAVHVTPTYSSGYRSFYQPSYPSYGPYYRGSDHHGDYRRPHYRSGYSHGAGFGTRTNLFIPGLIGG